MLSSIIPKAIVHVAESGLKNHQKNGYKSNNTLVNNSCNKPKLLLLRRAGHRNAGANDTSKHTHTT